jgi:hypothetical protein
VTARLANIVLPGSAKYGMSMFNFSTRNSIRTAALSGGSAIVSVVDSAAGGAKAYQARYFIAVMGVRG